MKNRLEIMNALLVVFFIATLISCNSGNKKAKQNLKENTASTPGKTLELKTTISLPEVKGGFDLMAIDLKGNRLFVSAQDNHSLEVLNLKTGTHLLSIPNLNEPKWVFYFPEKNRIYVATSLPAETQSILFSIVILLIITVIAATMMATVSMTMKAYFICLERSKENFCFLPILHHCWKNT